MNNFGADRLFKHYTSLQLIKTILEKQYSIGLLILL